MKPSQRKKPRVVSMRYPLAAEKKYAKMIKAWIKPIEDFSTTFIKENGEDLIRGDSTEEMVIRCDALPGDLFRRLVDSLKSWVDKFIPDSMPMWTDDGPSLWMSLGKAADDLNEANYLQWKRSSKSTMGVEFPKDEPWWDQTKKTWQTQNYTQIKKLCEDYITQINSAAEQAVVNGQSVKELTDQIQKIDTTMKKSRAEFIARDQMGKLNSMATQARMTNIGLHMYIWETAGDERVRSTHAPMDGLLCRWDDASVYSEDGGKTWIPRPGDAVHLHPGMDYQCRCVGTAYWEELIGEIDLAIDEEESRAS
jgi:SPP1 gp7 family putative phage head morphogenesis protein